jgi:hypothetical protein
VHTFIADAPQLQLDRGQMDRLCNIAHPVPRRCEPVAQWASGRPSFGHGSEGLRQQGDAILMWTLSGSRYGSMHAVDGPPVHGGGIIGLSVFPPEMRSVV